MLKKHIPNTITCCNLISGCIATYYAFQGDFLMALLFIIIGAVFDFFDGMSARLLGVSSPIGKELDSLADDITFGFAPSAIVFGFLSPLTSHLSPLIAFLAFIMAAFSALRLAKFNLDERQALGFIGLPTPANALFWGSLIVGLQQHDIAFSGMEWVILAGTFISSYLLIAESPHCRDSHVRPQVQALGLEGQRDQVYFCVVVHPPAAVPRSQRFRRYHCMVCGALCHSQ